MTPLTKIGKRLDNITRYILDNNPQDKWVLSNVVPMFLEAIKSSTTIQEEQLIISQLNKLLDNFEFRYNQIFEEKSKRDRCLRIADRKFDKPSAYKSGAVVRCRKGDIWKDLKETTLSSLTSIEPYNDPNDEYAQDLDSYLEEDNIDWRKESYITLLNPNQIQPSEWNFLSDDPKNPKSIKYSKIDPSKFPPILALKIGPNAYEAIDGIHRVYAFRLNNHMIPAIVITPKLKQGLNTVDTQMVNFMFNKYKDSDIPSPTKIINLKESILKTIQEDESLHKWFKRKGAPGKTGGWVDCNSPIRKDGKITGYKSCGRQKGEKRSKYPSCRPTASQCNDPGKGKTWGKTK
jgi:hypothetical protein